jgi:hypothetical protein
MSERTIYDAHCPLCGHHPVCQQDDAPTPYYCHNCNRGFAEPVGHSRSCPMLTPGSDDACTCALKERLKINTLEWAVGIKDKQLLEFSDEITRSGEKIAELEQANLKAHTFGMTWHQTWLLSRGDAFDKDAWLKEYVRVFELADDNHSLRTEIAAALDSIPTEFQVRVREGGAEENLPASLAVSVANLVRKLSTAEAWHSLALRQADELAAKDQRFAHMRLSSLVISRCLLYLIS